MHDAASSYVIDLVSGCAMVLACMALLLLLRCRTQRGAMIVLQAQLARERHCRELADQSKGTMRAQLCGLRAEHDGVRERERQRIARDIHDDLGQHLLALVLEAAALGANLPAARLQAGQLETHIKLAVRSLRGVIRDLRPEALEDGLHCAVERQLERFSSLSGIACQLQAEPAVFGRDNQHTAAVHVVLYRILQESLSNIARHARATEVWIALFSDDGQIGMTVRDNGIGLPCDVTGSVPDRGAGGGCGINGMTQRVRDAGGQLRISSMPGQGTAVSLSFPLDVALHQTGSAAPAAQ